MDSMYVQWSQQAPEEQRVGSSNDEWARDRTSMPQQVIQQSHQQPQLQHQQNQHQHQQHAQPQPPTIASPTLLAPSMEMNDYPSFTEITTSPSSQYHQYGQYGTPFFAQQAPFNAMAYGGQPWPSTTPPTISSYSSLNGATSPPPSQTQAQSHAILQQSLQQQSFQSHYQPQQHQVQQAHSPTLSPPSTHMAIDPTSNGSNSSSMPTSFGSITSPYPLQQPQQQQQPQQSNQGQSQTLQPRSTFYSTHPQLIYPGNFFHQAQSAPQGTMSPQALHTPSNGSHNSFYSSAPSTAHQGFQQQQAQHQQPLHQITMSQPVASTSQQTIQSTEVPTGLTSDDREERKKKLLNNIRPLLQPTTLTGAGSVNALTDRIIEYGIAEVDTATRLEILSRIRDGAGNGYYRAWSENTSALEITREWMKTAAKGVNPAFAETIMPLLHFVDRLPATLKFLKASKLGKVVRHLENKESTPAVKDMAKKILHEWRVILAEEEQDANASEDVPIKTKKRKLEPIPSTSKNAQPLKKAAVGSSLATKPAVVKKEPGTSKTALSLGATVKDAKADFSFFSAPKPKAKLPSFKKAPIPAPIKKEFDSAGNIAMGSSFDPFQEALKSMKPRKESPAAAPTPPPLSATTGSVAEPQPGLMRNGRRKKSVTWAPDGQLEAIKFIEKAIYDDDPVDGLHVTHSIRDLERGEGAAMHAHLFEETIDWLEPLPIVIPIDEAKDLENPKRQRGDDSKEKIVQEEREQSALGAVYMTPNQIPDSPAEPTNLNPDEEMQTELSAIPLGVEMETALSDYWSVQPPAAALMPQESVANLVSRLAMTDDGMSVDTVSALAGTAGTAGFPLSEGTTNLQQLLANLARNLPPAGFGDTPVPTHPSGEPAWPGMTPGQYDYTQSQSGFNHEEQQPQQQHQQHSESGRGWGGYDTGRGRGRGRGRGFGAHRGTFIKKRPCSFFLAGRCKYGDQCDFLHEAAAEY